LTVYFVIFGAAVRPDGSPSGTLRRRCEHAVSTSRAFPSPIFVATGGVGRHGPAEALVMRDVLIEAGVPTDRIVLETEARDTLESVRFCTRLLRRRGDVERVVVCSSSYHNPRCAWLFRLAGFESHAEPTPSDRPHLGDAKWLRYVGKEFIATPWDTALLLALKIGRAI
jgi:uncharacterized SAM-binding protein YcdF (DUF218 family)